MIPDFQDPLESGTALNTGRGCKRIWAHGVAGALQFFRVLMGLLSCFVLSGSLNAQEWTTWSSEPADGGSILDSLIPLEDQLQPMGVEGAVDGELARSSWEALPETGMAENAGAAPAAAPIIALSIDDLLEVGRGKTYEPTFFVSSGYDSNVFLTETNPTASTVFTVSPGFEASWGQVEDNLYFALDYDMTAVFYLNSAVQNSLNHELSLRFSHQWTKFRAGAFFDYAHVTGSDRELGAFTTQNLFRAGMELRHELTAKTTIGLETAFESSIYEDFINDNRFASSFFWDWAVTQKTTLGASVGGGVSIPETGPTEIFETLQLRWKYQPTERLSFVGTGGLELRQFLNTGQGTRPNLIFEFLAEWAPTERFNTSLRAYRAERNSGVNVGENFIATGVEIGLQKQFMEIMLLDLVAGFENDAYEGVQPGVFTIRDDNFLFVRPTLTALLSPRLTLGLYFEYRENQSNSPGNSFDNYRFGLEATFLF